MKRIPIYVFITIAVSASAFGQTLAPLTGERHVRSSLLNRLGYASDAKLLIVHADDLGMAHSVNAATIKAFQTGLVNSGSIMVPCPWFPEIAKYAGSNPDADLGLHLTLTSEWTGYRWGSVLSKESVSSLLNPEGYLYPLETEAARNANAREAEREIRAQIERARASGINPTHLDSHMGTLYQTEALFRIFVKVARENRLPIRFSNDWFSRAPFLRSVITADDIVLDRIIEINPTVSNEQWAGFYTAAIKSIQPGVTEMVVHLAYDDDEMRAMTIDHPDWGAGWRQRDFDFFTSAAFRRLLEENNIKLITWREIAKLAGKSKK